MAARISSWNCSFESFTAVNGAAGAAVVAASFLLAWAAEAAQLDISGGLAIAVLALLTVPVLLAGAIAITALEFGAPLGSPLVKLCALVGAPLLLLTGGDATSPS